MPNKVTCQLVDISTYYTTSQIPPDFTKLKGVEFKINPVSLERSIISEYSSSVGIQTRQANRQFYRSNREPVLLKGCIIHNRCKSEQDYLDKFEDLLFAKTPNTFPPTLALVFGKRVIQPVVLTNLSITETAWDNGFISQGTFDLTLEYVQPNRKTPRVSQDPKPTEREEAKNSTKNKGPNPNFPSSILLPG